jgi:hypothetical protein
MCWLFEQVLTKGKVGRQLWWVAPVFAQAKIAYSRMKRGLPANLIRCNDTDQTIVWVPNGGIMSFKSGEKPDNLYGEDVYAAVMDEASPCRVESYYALRSTLTATQGPIRIIGNVKGRKNWFFNGCRKAEGGEQGHTYNKIIATDAVAAGVFPQEELDDARRALPDAVFRELCANLPTTAAIRSGLQLSSATFVFFRKSPQWSMALTWLSLWTGRSSLGLMRTARSVFSCAFNFRGGKQSTAYAWCVVMFRLSLMAPASVIRSLKLCSAVALAPTSPATNSPCSRSKF